uniref:HTH CENPB-type domain-containing protein n=1 Tax=Angiostrongylus cantonensis TaxID=6313 RepID=A0A0K0DPA8_ANGCA
MIVAISGNVHGEEASSRTNDAGRSPMPQKKQGKRLSPEHRTMIDGWVKEQSEITGAAEPTSSSLCSQPFVYLESLATAKLNNTFT